MDKMNTPETPAEVQIQAYTAPELGRAHVGVVINNCPLIEVDGGLKPGFKMCARQAMEVGMNLIYLAKLAESMLPGGQGSKEGGGTQYGS